MLVGKCTAGSVCGKVRSGIPVFWADAGRGAPGACARGAAAARIAAIGTGGTYTAAVGRDFPYCKGTVSVVFPPEK